MGRKNKKQIILLVLAVIIVMLSFASCSISEDLIGSWGGSWMVATTSGGNDIQCIVDFLEDGTYAKVIKSSISGEKFETGTYTVGFGQVELHHGTDVLKYNYNGQELENNGHKLRKLQ